MENFINTLETRGELHKYTRNEWKILFQDLYAFEKRRDEAIVKAQAEADGEQGVMGMFDGMGMLNMFWSNPYRPNLLNTVMFLVKTAQQVRFDSLYSQDWILNN